MKKILPLLLFGWLSQISLAQSPCPNPIPISVNDTPPGCTICDFPITGSSTGYTPGPLTDGNYGCGNLTIQNDQYISFIVGSTGCVDFTIDAYNCVRPGGGNQRGLQGFIFDLGLSTTFDCTQGNQGTPNPAPFNVGTCGLTPGQAYLLVIDGYAGSQCDFTVSATGTQGGDFVSIIPDPVGPFCETDPITTLVGDPATGPNGTGTWSGDVSSTGDIDPAALGPGNFSATYSYTNIWGCMDDATVNFVINPAPIVVLDDAGPYCDNDLPVGLNYSPPGGTWTGPVSSSGVFDPTSAGQGSHNITYSVDINGCMNSKTISIDVFAAPAVTVDPIPDLCESDPVQTATATPVGGTWSGDIDPGGTFDPAVLGSGTFSGEYLFVAANGCRDSMQVSFTINPTPTVTISSAGPFCDNDSPINLTGNPSGGTWGGAAPGGSFDPTTLGSGTHNVTYSYTDANGCSDMTDIDIIVNNAPIITITPVGPFCESDPSVVVQATPPGGTWTGNIAPDGTFDPSTSGSGNIVVTYSFTNSDNCTESEDLTITVNPSPVVTIDPIPDLCSADLPTNATASPPGGVWSGDVGPNGEIDPAILGAGTFTATYNYTDAFGCPGEDNLSFNVNQSPDVTLDPAGPYCENDLPITLVFSPSGGTWTGPVSPSGVFDPATAGPGSHSITYTFIAPNGCDDSQTITIVVNQAPMPTINDPGPLCVSLGTTQLTASPSGGTWGPVANSNGEINPSVLGVGSYTVTYSFTNSLGCTEDTDLTIVVVPLPVVTIDPQPPVCENDGVTTLTGNPGGGTWTGDVDSGGSFDPSILGPGNYSATYEYTDGNGCMDTETTTFVINPAPMVVITPVTPQCESGIPVNVNATPPGGTWTGPISPTGVFDPNIAGPGTHTVTYSVTNSFGCTEEEMIDIEVVPDPIIDFLSPDTYCASDAPVILDASPFGGIWGGVADPFGEIDPGSLGPGTYVVTYTYTDPVAGCTAVLNQQITIIPGSMVVFSNTGPFCEDVGIQYITATPPGGTWSGSAGFNGLFNPNIYGVGVHDVTYTATDINGCIVQETIQVEILEVPVADIDPINDLCHYDSPVILTASPPGGVWGGAASSTGQVNPQNLGGGFHTATYTVTNPNGCQTVAVYDVEINDEIDVFFFNAGPFCLENQVQTLDADPFGGDWGGAVNFLGEFNPTNLGPGTFTATYQYYYGSTCNVIDSIQFTVLPADDVVFGDSVFCQNTGNQTLSATPSGGTWSGSNISPTGEIDTDNLPIGNFTVTYTVPQAGGACDITDNVVIEIRGLTATIAGNTGFCQTAGIQNFTGTPTGGSWGGAADAAGNVDPSNLSVGSHTVSYTATSATGCVATTDQIINVTAPPTAGISGAGTICPGGNATTDLTITLTGTGPWNLTYDLDAVPQVPISITSSPFQLSASQAGTYTLTGVTDASGCMNTATGTATVTELTPLSVTNINSQCNATNTGFTITFEISGGEPASYSVSGLTGMISSSAPYIFTSQNIPTGTPVNFTVSDNSGCAPVSENLTVDCSCETEVGMMNSTPIDICGTGTATAVYDPTGEFLDADDLVQYVLHTNGGISLGTVLATGPTPSFAFNVSSALQFGVTYYISAIAGSNDGNGNVDLNDSCLKVAQGTPVTWRENPTAILSGGTSVCLDSTATMTITFTGQAPWFVRYWNGTDTIDLNGITNNPFDLNVTPTTTTTYELVEVSNSFCDGSASGIEVVTVNDSPTLSTPTTQCDGTATTYTVSFTISGGDASSYNVSGLTGTLSGDTFTSDPINSGTGYSVSVSDANGCPPATFSDLIDCGCLTTVGTMDGTTLRICGDGPATATYDNTNEFLDADDIIIWYLHTNADNTIGTVIATNPTPEFSFDGSQMAYGTTYYISAAAGSDTGNGTIDLNDNCTDISVGTPVVFQLEPTAVLGNDMMICEGSDTTLTVTLSGTAPWAIVYNDGTIDRNLTISSSPFTIDISPQQNTTYTLVSVRDGNCPGTVSGSAEVTIVTAPNVDNLITECNLDKTEYTVSFDIIGGDPTSYNVSGDAGTLNGSSFTSDPISAGDGYSFIISDGNSCDQIEVSAPNVRCDCETDAGTVQNASLEACVGETVEIVHNSDEFLDANDTLMFALHDGSANFLGNVITLSGGTTFGFDASQMTTGTRYFISAVAGNRDLATGINLNDPCISVSTGIPVVFNPLPTVTISSDQELCEGDEAILTLQMTGESPFTVELSNGEILTDIISGFEYKITPTDDITISIVNITDAKGCQNTSTSEAEITVNTPPTATLRDADICNTTQNNNVSVLDLSSLITAGDLTGTWREIGTASGATGTLPELDFDGVVPGQYQFEYTTAAAIAPCVNAVYTVNITVSDCSCPSVATTPAGPFCVDDAMLDLTTITTTNEPGSWAITNAPTGSTAIITGNNFSASGSSEGDYELTFTLSQTPDPGCPENSVQTITLISPPTAVVTSSAEVCNSNLNGDPTTFDFSVLVTGGDTGGTWENVDGVNATGTLPDLDFDGIAPGVYNFRYRTSSATAPCNEAVYDVVLTVRDCSCPSVTTSPAGPFCNDAATLDLTTITVTAEPGNWTITNAPQSSTATIVGNNFDATGSTAGNYELTFMLSQTPPAGCDNSSTQTIQVSEFVSAGTGSGTIRICNDGTELNLNNELTGATSGGTWTDISATAAGSLFNNGILTTQNLPSGIYSFEYSVTTVAPCTDDSETIIVEIDNPVNAGDLIQNLSLCEGIDTTINLFDLIQNYDLGGVWTDISATAAASFNSNGTLTTSGLPFGVYQFQYALTTGGICSPDDVTVEVRMSESPVADAGETFELTCDIRTATIGGSNTSAGQNYSYLWLGSSTIEDPTAATTTVRDASTFTLRVTDNQSGCFDEDQVIITEEGSLPTLSADPIDITCFGRADGQIEIDGVTGGTPPYLYSINGSPFSNDNTFGNLTPGDYTLVVEDAAGCQDRLTFTIFEPDELTVRLETNLGAGSNLIQQGDSIQLNANISGTFDSIQWSPAEAFEPCDPEIDPLGCISPWVSPDRITTYEVFVANEKGCESRAGITVYVEKIRNVFIPSAFSPNDDGINDEFQIFTDDNVEKINTFLVFDRWGNLVFEYSDFTPDDPAGRWDGTFREKRMNTAVFAYFAQVEYKDGTTELFEGDVSLLK